jgi:hypothetical protein
MLERAVSAEHLTDHEWRQPQAAELAHTEENIARFEEMLMRGE